jgi:hypothetical protein
MRRPGRKYNRFHVPFCSLLICKENAKTVEMSVSNTSCRIDDISPYI